LEEYLKLMRTDYMNVARVISATTGKKEGDVVRDMNKQTSLMPEQAKDYGLVHDVRAQLIPARAGMTIIYEDASAFSYGPQPAQGDLITVEPVTSGPETVTSPSAESITFSAQGFTYTP
jgi:ClpP protease-like protein